MIRPLRADDEKLLAAMMDAFYHSEAVLHPVDRAHYQTTFRTALETDLADVFFLEEEGKTAGFALTAFSYSNEVGGLVVWLEELYICPEFRHRGFGDEFLDFLRNYYPQAKRFRLELTDENDNARALYRKHGFTPFRYEQMALDLPERETDIKS